MLNEALVRDGYAAAICAARIGEAGDDAEDDKSKYVFRLSACLPRMISPNSSATAVPGSIPRSRSRIAIVGSCAASCVSFASIVRIAFGVLAGARRPLHGGSENPGKISLI